MASAPRWQTALMRSLHSPENSKQYNRGVQLSTLDADNFPHVRTVGFREIVHPDDSPHLPVLLFATDLRMAKVSQIRQNPRVELVWWLPGSNDQFRIAGLGRVVASGDLGRLPTQNGTLALDRLDAQGYDWQTKRTTFYDATDPYLKASYIRPPPGSAIPSHDTAKDWVQHVPKLEDAKSDKDRENYTAGLKNYALLLIEATEIDWCELALRPHQRTIIKRDGEEWKEQPVVP